MAPSFSFSQGHLAVILWVAWLFATSVVSEAPPDCGVKGCAYQDGQDGSALLQHVDHFQHVLTAKHTVLPAESSDPVTEKEGHLQQAQGIADGAAPPPAPPRAGTTQGHNDNDKHNAHSDHHSHHDGAGYGFDQEDDPPRAGKGFNGHSYYDPPRAGKGFNGHSYYDAPVARRRRRAGMTQVYNDNDKDNGNSDLHGYYDGRGYGLDHEGDCMDDPYDWEDSWGYDCAKYVDDQECTPSGDYGPGWNISWGTFEDYAANGHTAVTACCGCGGGADLQEDDDPVTE